MSLLSFEPPEHTRFDLAQSLQLLAKAKAGHLAFEIASNCAPYGGPILFQKMKLLTAKLFHAITRPASIISFIGVGGFIIDMTLKPVSNAGLILLLAAASPWIIKTIKRLKVGDYLEIETLTQSEAERKLEKEAEEALAEEPEVAQNETIANANDPVADTPTSETARLTPDRDKLKSVMRSIKITEAMALDWAERQLGVPVQRQVRVENIELDGVALTKPTPTIIEIKNLSTTIHADRRVREALNRLTEAKYRWKKRTGDIPSRMLILITSVQPGDEEYAKLQRLIDRMQLRSEPSFHIRIISATDIGLDQGWFPPMS